MKREKRVKMKGVLLAFANPKGTDLLRLSAEDRAIRECIALSKYRENFLLEFKHATTINDLRRALLEKDYHLIHFSGHGTGKGLVLENELGEIQIVPQKALAEFLSDYSPPLECVILNACYTKKQGRLVSIGIPYTIAMEGPISDPAAIEFVRGFYDAIGAGKNIEFAYQVGRRTVEMARLKRDFKPLLLKSFKVAVKEFFQNSFPEIIQHSSTGLPLWLGGDILKVFEEAIKKATYSKDGQLTTRHILISLLELKDSISAKAISCLSSNIAEITKGLLKNIERVSWPVHRIQSTIAVQGIVLSLENLYTYSKKELLKGKMKGSFYFDDGRILQVALELQTESTTVVELLNDIQCTKEQLLQTIVKVRNSQASTPPRNKG